MRSSLTAFLLCIWLYAIAVVAAPGDTCRPVDHIVSILRGPLKGVAASFCSSYLRLPYITTQATTTTVSRTNTQTTTLANPTSTVTATTTASATATSTITAYSPDPTVSITSTVTARTSTIYQRRRALERRSVEKRALPPQLATFAASRLSSACSCAVKPTTSTVRPVVTVTSTASATVTVGGTSIVFVTQTTTVQATVTNSITTTLGATSTVTTITTTTVKPILVKPKICNAKGLPGANAFNYAANFNSPSPEACVASCKSDARCYSVGFYLVTDPSSGTTTGTCRSYDKSVTDSADLGFGYYTFYDKAC